MDHGRSPHLLGLSSPVLVLGLRHGWMHRNVQGRLENADPWASPLEILI